MSDEADAVLLNSGKRLLHQVVYATTEVGEYIEWLDETNQLAVGNLQSSLKVLAKDAGCYVIDTRNFLQSISRWKTPGVLEYNGKRMQEYGFQTIFERWLKSIYPFTRLCKPTASMRYLWSSVPVSLCSDAIIPFDDASTSYDRVTLINAMRCTPIERPIHIAAVEVKNILVQSFWAKIAIVFARVLT